MKILVPVDGSLCSLAAAREVAHRPWPEGSRVRPLHVVEHPFTPTQVARMLPVELLARFENNAGYAIDKALAQFNAGVDAPVSVEGVVLHGHPKKVILEESEKWGADLIVLASHGMTGLERLLLGSVSQAVMAHAKCSVEVVRPRVAGRRQQAASTDDNRMFYKSSDGTPPCRTAK